MARPARRDPVLRIPAAIVGQAVTGGSNLVMLIVCANLSIRLLARTRSSSLVPRRPRRSR